MLVVVSIMGLLVALLLPSLGGARQQSRAVVCAGNPRVLNELAGQHDGVRSAVDPRHNGRATTLWADGHVSRRTPEELGYVLRDDGSFMADDVHGDNRQWSVNARDIIAPGADVGMPK